MKAQESNGMSIARIATFTEVWHYSYPTSARMCNEGCEYADVYLIRILPSAVVYCSVITSICALQVTLEDHDNLSGYPGGIDAEEILGYLVSIFSIHASRFQGHVH